MKYSLLFISIVLSIQSFATCNNFITPNNLGSHIVNKVLKIYVSPNGDDDNDGSQNCPYKTLNRAHAQLVYLEPTLRSNFKSTSLLKNVQVILGNGLYTYTGSDPNGTGKTALTWTFSLPNKFTYISGNSNNLGQVTFVGRDAENYTFMRIVRSSRANTNKEEQNLVFRHFTVTGFREGINITGANGSDDNVKMAVSNDELPAADVRLYNLGFLNLGRAHNSGSLPSHAAVYVALTKKVSIKNSSFLIMSNSSACPDLTRSNPSECTFQGSGDRGTYGLHAVYVNKAEGVVIEGNSFHAIYGRETVKLRDGSHNAIIKNNRFRDNTTAISDQFCKHAGEPGVQCTSELDYAYAMECPSKNITISDNTIDYIRTGAYRKTLIFDSASDNKSACVAHGSKELVNKCIERCKLSNNGLGSTNLANLCDNADPLSAQCQ
jgi:hypothetical protein